MTVRPQDTNSAPAGAGALSGDVGRRIPTSQQSHGGGTMARTGAIAHRAEEVPPRLGTIGPRRGPAERATIDGMAEPRRYSWRTLTYGCLILGCLGVVLGAVITGGGQPVELRTVDRDAPTSTTTSPSTTVTVQPVPDVTMAPMPSEPVEERRAPASVAQAVPGPSTTLPPAPEAVTEEPVEPVAAQRTTAEPPPTTSTIAVCADGEPMRQYGCP